MARYLVTSPPGAPIKGVGFIRPGEAFTAPEGYIPSRTMRALDAEGLKELQKVKDGIVARLITDTTSIVSTDVSDVFDLGDIEVPIIESAEENLLDLQTKAGESHTFHRHPAVHEIGDVIVMADRQRQRNFAHAQIAPVAVGPPCGRWRFTASGLVESTPI